MHMTKLIFALEFDGICWVVRLCHNTYGDYLSKDQAVFDAMEAAADAQQLGHEAEVWDRSTGERLA
jgi:hypothetical protein